MAKTKKVKKNGRRSKLLFILILLAFMGIGGIILRDFNMTPAEQFETAQKAESEKQYRKAEKYYILAGASDDENVATLASYYLGRLYKIGGEGFPADGRKAEMFLERAALKGLPVAQYELALLYDTGDKIPENKMKAVAWMNEAAKAGHVDALYGLGVWVERGYLGQPDMGRVLALYEQAANQGQVQAMSSLIAIYFGGVSSLEPNRERADFWMEQLNKQMKRVK